MFDLSKWKLVKDAGDGKADSDWFPLINGPLWIPQTHSCIRWYTVMDCLDQIGGMRLIIHASQISVFVYMWIYVWGLYACLILEMNSFYKENSFLLFVALWIICIFYYQPNEASMMLPHEKIITIKESVASLKRHPAEKLLIPSAEHKWQALLSSSKWKVVNNV